MKGIASGVGGVFGGFFVSVMFECGREKKNSKTKRVRQGTNGKSKDF